MLAGTLLFATCAWSQMADLRTALLALENPNISRAVAAKHLADVMLPLADRNRQPSRTVVDDFAKELGFALSGKNLKDGQIANISVCLMMVMKGTVPNLKSTSLLREVLAGAGITDFEIGTLVRRFLAIGEDVRGPDDMQLSKVR